MTHDTCRIVRMWSDRGSSGVYVLVMLTLMLAFASLLGAVGIGLGARHQIARVADLSALAAAGLHSTTPCRDAERVATAHRMQLSACTWHAGRAEVTVTHRVPGLGPVSVTARAALTPP